MYSFNDGQLYARNPNIQLLQWYNNIPPNLQHFFFIRDTEELCFVEKGGRARIFNLVNQQFRPAFCNLPSNTENVLSTPDGSCIVAFVREKLVNNNPIDNATESKDNNNENNDENKHATDNVENRDDDSIISTDNAENRDDYSVNSTDNAENSDSVNSTDHVKNRDDDSAISTDNEDNEGKQNDSIKDDNIKEKVCRAYVYFCANFGGSFDKGL